MKIDKTKLVGVTTEMTSDCARLILSLRRGDSSIGEFSAGLDSVNEWRNSLGKNEMVHWADILNDCDDVLENATNDYENKGMAVDCTDEFDSAIISILRFTSLLFENSFSRAVYPSLDHLFKLLDSKKMHIVVHTLRLFMTMSKTSHYIPRHMINAKKQLLRMKLIANIHCWTALRKMNEYCSENSPSIDKSKIDFRMIDGRIMTYRVDVSLPWTESVRSLKMAFDELGAQMAECDRYLAFAKLRMLYNFNTLDNRVHCIMARLVSVSIIFYSHLSDEHTNSFLHNDFVEQLCDLLQVDVANSGALLDAMKTEVLKTLTSVVFLEKMPKIQLIVDRLGLGLCDGIIPLLIRDCIDKLNLIEPDNECSASFVISLFSLIYHIASFDYAGHALLSSSVISSMFIVVKMYSLPYTKINFVTRAVRIIDTLTSADFTEFNANEGLGAIAYRFVHEMNTCKDHNAVAGEFCHHQRVFLLKSLINFLRRIIVIENIETHSLQAVKADLLRSVIYIIENPEYFGPSLLHSTIQFITTFIYQDLTQLPILQDYGLTHAVIKLFFDEELVPTRDIVTSFPKICAALCLNEQGRLLINSHKLFERIFKIIFSTKFITVLRRRQQELLEAAIALGKTFNEVMIQHPFVRMDLMFAFAKLLDRITYRANSPKCGMAWAVGGSVVSTNPCLSNSEMISDNPNILKHLFSEEFLEQWQSSTSSMEESSSAVTKVLFRYCFEENGVEILPYGDYLLMIGAMADTITSSENSVAMLECNIHFRLVSLLTLRRFHQALLQSLFLSYLASIICRLLYQTKNVDPFHSLMINIVAHVKYYHCAKSVFEFNRHRVLLINRINTLVFVVCNLLEGTLRDRYDIRTLLVAYLGARDSKIIVDCLEMLRRLYIDAIYLNSCVFDSPSLTHLMQPHELQTIQMTQYAIHHLQKQLTEIVMQLNKIFSGIISTYYLDNQKTFLEKANNACSKLFQGIARFIEYDKSLYQATKWSCEYVCHVIALTKMLLFDDINKTMVMLPFFYGTGCHQLFFSIGRFIADNKLDQFLPLASEWLQIIERFVDVSNIKILNSRFDSSEGFGGEKYLSICHEDALMSLIIIFKRAMEEKIDNFMEGIIHAFGWLVYNIKLCYYLYKEEKSKQLDGSVNLNKVDKSRMEHLVKMGFSKRKAIDAVLTIHPSLGTKQESRCNIKKSDNIQPTVYNSPGTIHITPTPGQPLILYRPGTIAPGRVLHNLNEQSQRNSGVSEVTSITEACTTNKPTGETSATEQQVGNLAPEHVPSTSSTLSTTSCNIEGILPFNTNMSKVQVMEFEECLKFTCNNVVSDCIAIAGYYPTLVYCVSEFFSTIINETIIVDRILEIFVAKLVEDQSSLQEKLNAQDSDLEALKSAATSFSALVHLFCLIWQNIKYRKVQSLLDDNFISNITQMLFVLNEKEPEWCDSLIPSILLCLDMYKRKKRSEARRDFFNKNVEHIDWLAFNRNKEEGWNEYREKSQNILNYHFRVGHHPARATMNETHCLVDLVDMVQRSDEFSSYKSDDRNLWPVHLNAKLKPTFNLEEFFKITCCTENDSQFCCKMIHCLLEILKKGQNNERLRQLNITYSILSLLLRLLLTKGMTDVFVEAGGINVILRMLCAESCNLLAILGTMVLRACLDDDEVTLGNALSQMIQAVKYNKTHSTSRFFPFLWNSNPDWRHIARFLLPVAAFSAPIYHDMMRQIFQLRNNEENKEDINGTNELNKEEFRLGVFKLADCGPKTIKILDKIVAAVIDELFATDGLPVNNQERVFNATYLLRLLAELLNSYTQTTSIIVEMTRQNRSIIMLLIDLYIVQEIGSFEDSLAAKAVLVHLLNVDDEVLSRASEIIVDDIKTLLNSIITKQYETTTKSSTEDSAAKSDETSSNSSLTEMSTFNLCQDIVSLASTMLLLLGYAEESRDDNHTIKQTYHLIRHIHKKNLVVDFARAIWYLPMSERSSSNAITVILYLFQRVSQGLIEISCARSDNCITETALTTTIPLIPRSNDDQIEVDFDDGISDVLNVPKVEKQHRCGGLLIMKSPSMPDFTSQFTPLFELVVKGSYKYSDYHLLLRRPLNENNLPAVSTNVALEQHIASIPTLPSHMVLPPIPTAYNLGAYLNARRLPHVGNHHQNTLQQRNTNSIFSANPRSRRDSYSPPMFHHNQDHDLKAELHFIRLFVPLHLDRVFEKMKLIDGGSMHYVGVIITSYLANILHIEEEELSEISDETSAEEADGEESYQTSDADDSGNEDDAHESNELATETAEHLQITGSELQPLTTSSVESAMSGIQTTNIATIANESISLPTEQVESTQDILSNDTMNIGTTTVNLDSQPSTSRSAEPSTMDDFREILGDIEIPDGVDPAFLAALPPDIREEVIRDRMTRGPAQPITQTRHTNVTSDDTLDQEFLNALVPKLQEEVLAQHQRQQESKDTETALTTAVSEAAANNQFTNANADSAAHSSRLSVESSLDVFRSVTPGILSNDRDTILQAILTPNMLTEANRLRAQQLRFDGFFGHQSSTVPFGYNVISPSLPEQKIQMFDKESLSTVLLLFMSLDKPYFPRLPILLKSVSRHPGTCDQVIWSTLSILNVLDNIADEETISLNDDWFDTLFPHISLKKREKALFICPTGVKVHPHVRYSICLNILEALHELADGFPQHFLSNQFRQVLADRRRFDNTFDLNALWDMAREISCKSKENFKLTIKPLICFREIVSPLLEKSPLAFIMDCMDMDIIRNSPSFMNDCLKIILSIMKRISDDSLLRINDDTFKWLYGRIYALIDKIMLSCCEDGLQNGRLFLFEIIRILPTLRSCIFKMIFELASKHGEKLQADMNVMLERLKKAESDFNEKNTSMENLGSTNCSNSTISPEVKLNMLVGFTKPSSEAEMFLGALETISFLNKRLSNLVTRRKEAKSALTPDPTFLIWTTSLSATNHNTITSLLEDATVEERCAEEMLDRLEPLWSLLSTCLDEVSRVTDAHTSLQNLQKATKSFLFAHSFIFNQKELQNQQFWQSPASSPAGSSPSTTNSNIVGPMRIEKMNKHMQRMFYFAEKHRPTINKIFRDGTDDLVVDAMVVILTCFPRVLDFDVKRDYFYGEIHDNNNYQEDISLRVRRDHVFGDSFRELVRLKADDWKIPFQVVFEGEEGQDAGGLLREWYSIITREIFNPNYALFITAPGDRVTYMINKSSYVNPEHLDYFNFVGRVIAKAMYDNKQLDCYFTRAFYKHILNVPVRYQDIESEDPSYFKSLEYLLENPLEEVGVDLTFTVEVEEFGKRSVRKLCEDGDNIQVTDANKAEYVRLVCQMKMTGSIRQQLDAFLAGFYQIIPKKIISIFNEQELELLISGLPMINIDDLYNNTNYKGYNRLSLQIQWFWRALRSFEREDLAMFLQFVTGTSKVPLQGFSHLEGMNGVQKFTIQVDPLPNDRLPTAHTCFNQLDLPRYDNYEQLRTMLLFAIRECPEGFALV